MFWFVVCSYRDSWQGKNGSWASFMVVGDCCVASLYHRRLGSEGPRTGGRVNMEPSSIPSPQSTTSTSHFENTLIGKRGVIFKTLIQEIQSATPSVETAVHIYVCAFNSKFWLPALRQRMVSFKVDHVSQHYTLKDKN